MMSCHASAVIWNNWTLNWKTSRMPVTNRKRHQANWKNRQDKSCDRQGEPTETRTGINTKRNIQL